jgi:hypothetical protein
MHLTARDIVRAHSSLGPGEEIIEQRRAIYLAAIELTSAGSVPDPPPDVLDNPAVRAHLGAALSTGDPSAAARLCSVDGLVAEGCALEVLGCPVQVASSADAPDALRGAVGRISDELRRHGVELPAAWLLTAEAPGFPVACERLAAGVRMALEVAPELTRDLLAHVALFAVLADEAGRLGSASAREYPGLVLVPEPATAVEVAEAVVHEGAHQAFFDFSLTRAILGPEQYEAPPFTPSWAQPGAPPWPMEQCYAAFHAYCCLSAFADALGGADLSANPSSLLPMAAVRADEIGDWLLNHGRLIQPDGHALLRSLTGHAPVGEPAAAAEPAATPSVIDAGTVVRPCGPLTLVARKGHPADLLWVRSDRLPG